MVSLRYLDNLIFIWKDDLYFLFVEFIFIEDFFNVVYVNINFKVRRMKKWLIGSWYYSVDKIGVIKKKNRYRNKCNIGK